MAQDRVVKTTCKLCQSTCGMLVHVNDSGPFRVEGDPEFPVNRGLLCDKGKAALEYLYHPDRLKYPLKRTGERGEGKWQRISWDEALDIVASELLNLKNMYGAESVVFIRGWAKGTADIYSTRFANVFGSPNVGSMAPVCYQPRSNASNVTYGFLPLPDYDGLPACIVTWGLTLCSSSIGDYVGESKALENVAKFIVIDPADTENRARADIWVRLRPGTDLALALGMINIIINEGLYDKEFVKKWTVGFDELRKHVQDYTPEKVAEITWVPAETIKDAARMYATNKPACIATGNGLENNINNFQTLRAIAILRSITGNLGIPGGDISWSPSGVVTRGNPEFTQRDAITPDIIDQRINGRDKYLPSVNYALPHTIVTALKRANPYQIRGAFIQAANLLLSWSNSLDTYAALKELDFMVVTDMFMTPTAELADIVLPVCTFLEMDSVSESPVAPYVGVTRKVAQIGESRSDYQIYQGMAKRMGLEKYFPEERYFLDWLLEPAGLYFDELCRIGYISGSRQYRTYEKAKFSTPSKKVELYSKRLKEGGFDPLPVYHEPPESPYSEPALFKEYPLIFTNCKYVYFTHSSGRQISALRKKHPEPVVSINTETAKRLGISEGDWVCIENKRGKIRQKATLNSNIDPRVIIADYGWWFPEKGVAGDMHGWKESNINILTSNKQPYASEMGSATLKGILCKVYKES